MLKFKEFISEAPELEFGDSRRFSQQMTEPLRDFMKENHKSSDLIGKSEEGTYHKLSLPGDRTGYYHYVTNSPREISIVKIIHNMLYQRERMGILLIING